MSNRNMNWQQFLTEFVLRTLTQIEVIEASDEAYYIRASIRVAREAWDAIQAAELPESEKAKQKPITANSTDLRALARSALEASNNKARWIAIDASGGVWAYDLRPDCYEQDKTWDNSPTQGSNWFVRIVAPPDDFTNELYEISKIVSDDL